MVSSHCGVSFASQTESVGGGCQHTGALVYRDTVVLGWELAILSESGLVYRDTTVLGWELAVHILWLARGAVPRSRRAAFARTSQLWLPAGLTVTGARRESPRLRWGSSPTLWHAPIGDALHAMLSQRTRGDRQLMVGTADRFSHATAGRHDHRWIGGMNRADGN